MLKRLALSTALLMGPSVIISSSYGMELTEDFNGGDIAKWGTGQNGNLDLVTQHVTNEKNIYSVMQDLINNCPGIKSNTSYNDFYKVPSGSAKKNTKIKYKSKKINLEGILATNKLTKSTAPFENDGNLTLDFQSNGAQGATFSIQTGKGDNRYTYATVRIAKGLTGTLKENMLIHAFIKSLKDQKAYIFCDNVVNVKNNKKKNKKK